MVATERFEMRIESDLLERLDSWRTSEEDTPSRAEAVRRLVEAGLAHDNKGKAPHLTDGEKLIAVMVAEMIEKLNLKTDTDTALVQKAIYGGHFWALGWEMSGLFHGHADKQSKVRFVVDVLDMWSFIEEAYRAIDEKGRKEIAGQAGFLGTHVKFLGFDGNNESEYLNIASFLTRDLDRFTEFSKSDLNSHMPMVPRYAAMFGVFEPIRRNLIGRTLSVAELVAVLSAESRTR